jgi:hypothetical protein
MRCLPKPKHARALNRAGRHTLFGVALIGFVCGFVQPSDAYIEHPWCTSGRGWAGGTSCAFDTYEHCMENARLYRQLRGQPCRHAVPAGNAAGRATESALPILRVARRCLCAPGGSGRPCVRCTACA